MRLPSPKAVTCAAAVVLLNLLGLATVAVPAAVAVAPIVNVSGNCGGQNAEVEEATAPPGNIYQLWIGCGGIGFARSTNGGATYSSPIEMPGSGGGWDPSIAVGPTGIVYAAYMVQGGGYYYPVVSASFDQGATFTQTTNLLPPATGNYGDRDFIAVAPDGTVYVTWDYGPDASKVQIQCYSSGSCAYSAGDLNSVVQKSTDGGKTFGPITPIGPGYPIMGGFSAPVLVAPSGTVDALYWGHQTDPNTYALSPGYEYFTDSADGGNTWSSAPQQLCPSCGSIALSTWWIDGDLAIDSGGTLYATWDTQASAGDIGYLSYSSDGGNTWSTPVRVTPDTDSAIHDVEVIGGAAGTAYVAWQTDAPSQGYATYLQTFTTATGMVGTPEQISTAYGNSSVWPGDTFGMALMPSNQIALSWGSAINGGSTSEIYATVVPLTDFALSASPASGTVVAGNPATTTVSTTAHGGDTEAVNLTASGLPAGVTATFSPASVTAGGSATLTLSTSTTTPNGSYPITITGTGTSNTHTTSYTLTVTSNTNVIVNGGFETGNLTDWTCGGQAAACSVTTSSPHSGQYAAMLGSTSPTNGTSSTTQSFTAPAGSGHTLSFWYNVTCPDTVNHDWATATLKDNTTGQTTTVLPKTCVASSGWKQVTASITAGHSYTITLTNRDDNHPGNATFTKYDDVATS